MSRSAGLSSPGIQLVECLRAGNDAGDSCPDSVAVYRRKIAEVDAYLAQFTEVRAAPQAKLDAAVRGRTGGVSMDIVTEETFADRVLGHDKPVLVDYWAQWCPPCRMIAPVLAEIAAERADTLSIVQLNYDDHPAVGQRYGVLGLPTMLLFRDGEPVCSFVGAKSKARLLAELDEALRA